MKYSTYTGNLMWTVESASPAPCKTPAKFIDFICPNNQARQSKDTRNGSNSKQIVLYSHTLEIN